jgi:hypothetical protein
MASYLLTYHGAGGMAQSEAEIAESMAVWGRWFEELGSALVDGGKPAAATRVISSDGTVTDGGPGSPTGYTVLRADSHDAAVELARGCPVLKGTGTMIEVTELLDVM